MRHLSSGCSFARTLRVVYFPLKHPCIYNNKDYVLGYDVERLRTIIPFGRTVISKVKFA